MQVFRVFLLSFLLVLAASFAVADEVFLKNGGSIKGDVVSQDDTYVVLKTAYGSVTFETSDISKVEYSTPLEKKLLADLAALAPSDIPSRMKLAKRAAGSGLDEVSHKIYGQILAIDPDDKNARKALGYVKYEGEWVTPKDKQLHQGLVPYKGRWVTRAQRDVLIKNDEDRAYFARFDVTPSQGQKILEAISDFKVEIEPRGGFLVRRHVSTIPVKDKPYVYSVDALTWKRLGVFVTVSFIDQTRRRVPGFGDLRITIYSVATDAVGNRKPAKPILTETVSLKPEMWEKKSDVRYWDTRINHSSYEKHPSDETKKLWFDNYFMNFDGVLYVLANRDINLLAPPGIYYVEAVFTLKNKEKKAGRYVQYAEAR